MFEDEDAMGLTIGSFDSFGSFLCRIVIFEGEEWGCCCCCLSQTLVLLKSLHSSGSVMGCIPCIIKEWHPHFSKGKVKNYFEIFLSIFGIACGSAATISASYYYLLDEYSSITSKLFVKVDELWINDKHGIEWFI